MKRLSLICCIVLNVASLYSQSNDEGFQIQETSVTKSQFSLTYPSEEGFYYILNRGQSVDSIAESVALAAHPKNSLGDKGIEGVKEAFYRIHRVPMNASLDLDGDGIRDVTELSYPGVLDPLDSRDADLDFDNDGETNRQELNNATGATDPADAVFETIEFQTEDNFTIAASLGGPKTTKPKMPAIIFIHQGGSNRHEWRSVAKMAFREGWTTLAYDIRGHGDSSGRWTNAWYDDSKNVPEDLKAAIAYLKELPNIDDERIAVVGASVGGNLACVASALYQIKTAVAISHKTSAVLNLAGTETLEFRSIYHLSSQGDQGGQRAQWATDLFDQTEEPRKLEIIRGSGHGVAIFGSDRALPDRIIQWLRDTL